MKTTNVYPHVVAPATDAAQSLPGFDTATLSYRFASGTLPFQTLFIHIKRNIMKSIFTPVKTVIAVLTLILVSAQVQAQGNPPELTINNTSVTLNGCQGGTVNVNFTTSNGGGTAYKFHSVEESAEGYTPTTFTIILTAVPGGETYSRTFQISGIDFPEGANAGETFTYGVPLPADAPVGNYSLTLSSIAPTASSSTSVPVDVTLNPTGATISGSSASACAGGAQPTVTFLGSGQTGGSYTFYYTVDGAAASVTTASGVDNATVNIPNATAHTAVVNLTGVSHTAAAACGIKNLDESVNIEIYPATAINSFSAAAASYCLGDAATALSVTAIGGNLSYQWYSNTSASNSGGTAISGAQSASYTPDITAVGTMYYYVVVTGDCGSATSSVSGAIVVNALPSGSISGNLALDCNTTSTTLTAPAGASYLWSTGATTSTITVSTAGTFTVVVTNAAGCSAEFSASTTLTNTPPSISIGKSDAELTCSVSSITLTASGADSYVWANGQGNAASIDVTAAGTYTVTGTNTSTGCSAAQSITIAENKQPASITVPAATELDCNLTSIDYSISGATNVTVQVYSGPTPSISTSSVSFTAAGSYRIDAFNGNCLTSENVTITEAPLPTASVSAPAAVCASNPAATLSFVVTGRGNITVNYTDGSNNYSVSGTAGTLAASVSPSVNTTYSITSVVDGNGCSNTSSSTASIEVSSCGVTFGIDRVDPTCAGSTNGKIVITNIQGDGAPFQISNNNGFSFVPVSNPALFEFKNLGAGVYNIILKNKDGKLQPLSTTTLIDPKAITANINTSGDISCGTPNTMLMISNVQGGNGAPYAFSLDGGAFGEATSFEVGAGAHSIMAKDKNGCTQQIGSVTLNGPAAVVMGATQVKNVTSFGGNNGSISLTVSGGSNSYMVTLVRPGGSNTVVNAGNATITFSNLVAGAYEVMVADNDGCGTVSKQLTISQPEQAPIPSADLVLGSETNTNIFSSTGAGVTIIYHVQNISATGDANGVKLRISKPSRDYSISLPATDSYTNGAGEMVGLDNRRWTVTADTDLYVELSLDNDANGNNMIPAGTVVPKNISVTITRNSAAMGKGEFPISAVIYASLPDANDQDNGTSHKYTAQ